MDSNLNTISEEGKLQGSKSSQHSSSCHPDSYVMGALTSAPRAMVLIAEDHESTAETYKIMLENLGFEVILTVNGQECIQTFDRIASYAQSSSIGTSSAQEISNQELYCKFERKSSVFEIVILDYHLPGRNGMDIARHILSAVPSQRIVIASSYPASVINNSARAAGISLELLIKPFGLEELIAVVQGQKILEIIGGSDNKSGRYSGFELNLHDTNSKFQDDNHHANHIHKDMTALKANAERAGERFGQKASVKGNP